MTSDVQDFAGTIEDDMSESDSQNDRLIFGMLLERPSAPPVSHRFRPRFDDHVALSGTLGGSIMLA